MKLWVALDSLPSEPTPHGKLVEVRKTHIFRELGISQTYYSPIWGALEQGGCIEVYEKGTHGRPSRIMLLREPTEDTFSTEVLTQPREPDILRQRIENIERRLDGVEIKQVIASLVKRQDDLDSRLKKLEDGR
jgi:hypothetical protein